MTVFLLTLHVLVCIVLVVSILLQAGKGGGLAGGAFGGAGSSGAVFGGTGAATFLTKVTTYVAILFFMTCIGLWYSSRTSDTLPKTAAEKAGALRSLDQQQPSGGIPQGQAGGSAAPAGSAGQGATSTAEPAPVPATSGE